MPDWALHFHAFGALHGYTVLGFSLLWCVLIGIGLRLRGTAAQTPWRAVLSVAVLLAWLLANGVQLLPGKFVASVNLPLQVCDIAGLLAGIALWLRQRLLFALLYFCGVGFSSMAMATPELVSGPTHIDFWTFWVPHANLTGAACYILVVEGFRPRWRDCLHCYGFALLYLVLILPFDLLTGFNYGYVGPVTLEQRTILDWLGPWPWRIGSMMVVAAFAFALMQWPWSRRSETTQ